MKIDTVGLVNQKGDDVNLLAAPLFMVFTI